MTEIGKSKWGPRLWCTLHAMGATMEDAEALRTVLRGLSGALPCPECRQHFAAHLALHPPDFATPQEACNYLFALHNDTNARLGKPALAPQSYEADYGVLPSEAAAVASPVPSSRAAAVAALPPAPPAAWGGGGGLVAAGLFFSAPPVVPRPSLKTSPAPRRYQETNTRWSPRL